MTQGQATREVSFSEFRREASSFIDEVERGAVIVILRHGRPVAEIGPPRRGAANPSWKNPGLRLVVEGASLTRLIDEERNRE